MEWRVVTQERTCLKQEEQLPQKEKNRLLYKDRGGAVFVVRDKVLIALVFT